VNTRAFLLVTQILGDQLVFGHMAMILISHPALELRQAGAGRSIGLWSNMGKNRNQHWGLPWSSQLHHI
jgi:hypothetical protein